MSPRDRRHLLLLAIALMAPTVAMQGCATDARQPVRWALTQPHMATDYYAWETRTDARFYCRLLPGERGSCAPVRIMNGIVPAGARRMSDDSLVTQETRGRVCVIFSTATWAEAAWWVSGYRGDSGSHLDHEKRHCAGWTHQPIEELR